jgi:hypothetical protein
VCNRDEGRRYSRPIGSLRDNGVVPLICPTCQVFAESLKVACQRLLLLCMGLFSIFCSWERGLLPSGGTAEHHTDPCDFVDGRDAVERARLHHSFLVHRACSHEPSGADVAGLTAQINRTALRRGTLCAIQRGMEAANGHPG